MKKIVRVVGILIFLLAILFIVKPPFVYRLPFPISLLFKTLPPEQLTSSLPQEFAETVHALPDKYLITNVSLIPMNEDTILSNHFIWIAEGNIQHISPHMDTVIKDTGYRKIEGRGKFLIPGLADMHVHVNDENNLLMSIVYGVTTTRNMAGFSFHLDIKKALEEKRMLGPRFYTTGPILEGPQQIWRNAKGGLLVNDPDHAEEVVRQLHQEGYDFIKVYHTLDTSYYRRIMQTAAELDMPVVGHIVMGQPLAKTLEMGQHSIEHISPRQWREISPDLSLEEKVQMIGESETWMCPTLVVIKKVNGRPGDSDLPKEYEAFVDRKTRRFWPSRLTRRLSEYELRKQLAKRAYDAGGKLLAGTDALNAYVLHGASLHEELQELVAIGLSEYEALQTATLHPAEYLGKKAQSGTLELGKEADMVLLNHNPLEDIQHTTSIEGVMLAGKWLDSQLLEKIKVTIKESYQ